MLRRLAFVRHVLGAFPRRLGALNLWTTGSRRRRRFRRLPSRFMGQLLRLQTGYVPPERDDERPVTKQVVAARAGVSTKTVDRWVSTYGLPEERGDGTGCWIQVGAHRRYYMSRCMEWNRDRHQVGVPAALQRLHDGYARAEAAQAASGPQEPAERPIGASLLASRLDVSTTAIYYWMKNGLPSRALGPLPSTAWTQHGGCRSYYESRVREWLNSAATPDDAGPRLLPR